jgi:hypothetical protein
MRTKVLWSMAAMLFAAGTVRAVDANDVKAELARRIGQLKNVIVVYDFKNIPQPGADDEQNKRTQGVSYQETVGAEREVKFYFLDGKARYESMEMKLPIPVSDSTGTMMVTSDIAETSVQIAAGGSRELLCGYRGGSYFKGFIRPGVELEHDDTIDVTMGMRASFFWLNDKSIAACKVANTPSKDAVEFTSAIAGTKRWTLSPEHGYAPVVQETINGDGFVHSRTEMSDWRKVGDLWIAYKAVKTDFAEGEDGKPKEVGFKTVLTIKSCEIGSKENVPSLYKMVWPDGTIVKDRDGREYEAKGGELKVLGTQDKE